MKQKKKSRGINSIDFKDYWILIIISTLYIQKIIKEQKENPQVFLKQNIFNEIFVQGDWSVSHISWWITLYIEAVEMIKSL